MSIAHTQLRRAADTAMDCKALNDQQALLILNASPEVDSLGEHIERLVRFGVPDAVVNDMRRLLRELSSSNAREASGERALTRSLDDMATAAAHGPRPLARLTDKDLAAAIRRALDDGSIGELIASTPRARLTSRNLLRALRPARAEQLMRALGAADRPGVAS